MISRESDDSDPRGGSAFPSTCWSQLLSSTPVDAASRLEKLARDYFEPVVAYLRASQRIDRDAALDWAQGFFAHILETDWLERADPNRGRFRGFLKRSLENFVRDERRRDGALRRGGDRKTVPFTLDPAGAASEPIDLANVPPEVALDRAWRRELVERALADTGRELCSTGREKQFVAFQSYFLTESDSIDYRAIGDRLGLSAADVSNALQRTKALFRAKLKARVLETVASASDLDQEWRWLFQERERLR